MVIISGEGDSLELQVGALGCSACSTCPQAPPLPTPKRDVRLTIDPPRSTSQLWLRSHLDVGASFS